jgi:branched-chain amino acid transport system permease protein
MVLWAGSFALATLAALLVEPTVGLITPGYASTLYLGGLVAAVIGRLTSLPGAVVGAVVLGLAEAASARYLHTWDVPGMNYLVMLAVLLLALLGRAYGPVLRARVEGRPRLVEAQA